MGGEEEGLKLDVALLPPPAPPGTMATTFEYEWMELLGVINQ